MWGRWRAETLLRTSDQYPCSILGAWEHRALGWVKQTTCPACFLAYIHTLLPALDAAAMACLLIPGLPILIKDLTAVKGLPFIKVRLLAGWIGKGRLIRLL